MIKARFDWWIETKTVRRVYDAEGHGRHQVRQHAKLIADEPEAQLLVLTPDFTRPGWFTTLDGVPDKARLRVTWISFAALADAITAIVSDPTRVVGEQTRFLLSELVQLYDAEGLLSIGDDTVVVAARAAWPVWNRYSAYVCQPNRSFRHEVERLGFYYEGKIMDLVPKRIAWFPEVTMTAESAASYRASGEGTLASLITTLLADDAQPKGAVAGVMLLTGPNDPGTEILPNVVVSDAVGQSGKVTAWTMGQRYTSLAKLKHAQVTSQL